MNEDTKVTLTKESDRETFCILRITMVAIPELFKFGFLKYKTLELGDRFYT